MTIYVLPLPLNLINRKGAIALEPEYIKWDLKNKMGTGTEPLD